MALKRKKALCIGNNEYNDKTLGALQYAVNDAEAIGRKLSDMGFSVETKTDLDGKAMATAIGDVIDTLDNYDVFLFYYAGHGCQISGSNYLIPTDAMWNDGTHAFGHECISLSNCVMDELKKYPNVIKIVILDACRQFHDNSRGTGSCDFVPFSSPADSIIALSTSPGCVAKESIDSCHGRYTNVLLRYIDMPHVNIETVFKRVRQDMVAETDGEQIPWEHTSLVRDFKLNPHYINDGMKYSKETLGEKYRCMDAEARALVDELRNGDYNVENAAVGRITSLPLDSFSSDDLFYIGRSIFYAAVTGNGPSFSAQFFIRDFDIKKSITLPVKEHLLAGIAYESYFGGFTSSPVTSRYSNMREIRLCVFSFLEKECYSKSRIFIANALSEIEDRPVFIPGDDRIQFSVALSEDWLVKSINHEGKPILTYEGVHLTEDDIRGNCKPTSIDGIKEKLSIALNTNSACIDLIFNRDVRPDQKLLFLMCDFDLIY